jgi:cation-transporting P-type ATPase E
MKVNRLPVLDRPELGLSEAEAGERAARGQSNVVRDQASRSLAGIIRANLFTRFNALLGGLLVVTLIVGPPQDAVFGLVLLANVAVAVVQELRAKATLDRLAVLSASRARVVRGGNARLRPAADVVLGDLLELRRGDELVVDGSVESTDGLEVDEALLTGESEPRSKSAGDTVLAGSFVSSGSGLMRATKVGEERYARRMTIAARRFQLVRSELLRALNQILRLVTWIIGPLAVLLVVSQLRANPSLPDAIRGSVAGVITLVPEGLILLSSAALALAVLRLGRRRVIIQQLAAVEMLARTDVLCLDKTGTLTTGVLRLLTAEPLIGGSGWREALGALVHADPDATPTARALASEFAPPNGWTVTARVPFSSARKWASATFAGRGTWVLGAPDLLLPPSAAGVNARLRSRLDGLAGSGQRVLLFARAEEPSGVVLGPLTPLAVLALGESLRPDARATIEDLAAQGVAVKVISGDHPATVAAIARAAGLTFEVHPVDGPSLPPAGEELNRIAEGAFVFGRVTPEQKRDLVAALRRHGHTVTMVGDGVNDVLALKEADLGIALGDAAGAARAIAAVVVPDGTFAVLPAVLYEGRRVVTNVERLASLYLTKTIYALLIVLGVVVATLPFPFLPRQLTLVSAFTIGIPSVVLVLGPASERLRPNLLGRVLAFAIPAGVVAAAGTFAAYLIAVSDSSLGLLEERTVATLAVAACGLWILARLARPLTAARRLLLWSMTAGLLLAVAVAPVRDFFALDIPGFMVLAEAAGVVVAVLVALEAGDRLGRLFGRRPDRDRQAR